MRSVIAGDEEFYFFTSWIDSDCVQAFSDVVDGDLPDAVLIKNVEGVEEIEISFGRELNFAGLQLALQRALLSQGVHELVFIWNWENGLVGMGCPCCWLLMLPWWLCLCLCFKISLWLSSKPRLWHSWSFTLQKLSKFVEIQASVSICIDSADNSQQFNFTGMMAACSQIGTQTYGVYPSCAIPIYRPKGSQWRIVKSYFQFSLQNLQPSLQIDLLLDDDCTCHFNVSGQKVIATDSVRRSR